MYIFYGNYINGDDDSDDDVDDDIDDDKEEEKEENRTVEHLSTFQYV